MSGCETTAQNGAQFEDALRRLNALEAKLASQVLTLHCFWVIITTMPWQVLEDISELRKQWVQGRVDRVSHNTFKLYQVRKNLKTSKVTREEKLCSINYVTVFDFSLCMLKRNSC